MTEKDLKNTYYQLVEADELEDILLIYKSYKFIRGLIAVYGYGVMQGKRQERARKNKHKGGGQIQLINNKYKASNFLGAFFMLKN